MINLTLNEFFSLRRWYRGYCSYWVGAQKIVDEETGTECIIADTSKKGAILTDRQVIISALKKPLYGIGRTFLEDTVYNLCKICVFTQHN